MVSRGKKHIFNNSQKNSKTPNTGDIEALKIHGYRDNVSVSSSDSGKSEFDAVFDKYKPGPIDISTKEVVTIGNNGTFNIEINHDHHLYRKPETKYIASDPNKFDNTSYKTIQTSVTNKVRPQYTAKTAIVDKCPKTQHNQEIIRPIVHQQPLLQVNELSNMSLNSLPRNQQINSKSGGNFNVSYPTPHVYIVPQEHYSPQPVHQNNNNNFSRTVSISPLINQHQVNKNIVRSHQSDPNFERDINNVLEKSLPNAQSQSVLPIHQIDTPGLNRSNSASFQETDVEKHSENVERIGTENSVAVLVTVQPSLTQSVSSESTSYLISSEPDLRVEDIVCCCKCFC